MEVESDDGSTDASSSESEEDLQQQEEGGWVFMRPPGDPTGYWYNVSTRRTQWTSPGFLSDEELSLASARTGLDTILNEKEPERHAAGAVLSPRALVRRNEREKRKALERRSTPTDYQAWIRMARNLHLVSWVQTKLALQTVFRHYTNYTKIQESEPVLHEGYLKKQSRKGVWHMRYFRLYSQEMLCNHHASNTLHGAKGCHILPLQSVVDVSLSGREFRLSARTSTDAGDFTTKTNKLKLKARDVQSAQDWHTTLLRAWSQVQQEMLMALKRDLIKQKALQQKELEAEDGQVSHRERNGSDTDAGTEFPSALAATSSSSNSGNKSGSSSSSSSNSNSNSNSSDHRGSDLAHRTSRIWASAASVRDSMIRRSGNRRQKQHQKKQEKRDKKQEQVRKQRQDAVYAKVAKSAATRHKEVRRGEVFASSGGASRTAETPPSLPAPLAATSTSPISASSFGAPSTRPRKNSTSALLCFRKVLLLQHQKQGDWKQRRSPSYSYTTDKRFAPITLVHGAAIGRGKQLGVSDKNLSRTQVVVEMRARSQEQQQPLAALDYDVMLVGNGRNASAIVDKISAEDEPSVRYLSNMHRLQIHDGQVLELDGFKRLDKRKYPKGPEHCFVLTCRGREDRRPEDMLDREELLRTYSDLSLSTEQLRKGVTWLQQEGLDDLVDEIAEVRVAQRDKAENQVA